MSKEKKPDLDFTKFKYMGAGYAIVQRVDGEGVENIHTPELCKRAAAQLKALEDELARLREPG